MRTLILLNMPLCLSHWLEPVVAEATGLRRTWKIGGEVLSYALVGMPRFLPSTDPVWWPQARSVLGRCPAMVVQEMWNPSMVRRYARENPDKAQVVLIRPSFEEVVYRNWLSGWPAAFGTEADLFQRVLAGRQLRGEEREKHLLEVSLPAFVEGFRRVYMSTYGGLPIWDKNELCGGRDSLFRALEALGYDVQDRWDWRHLRGPRKGIRERLSARNTREWSLVQEAVVEGGGVPDGW